MLKSNSIAHALIDGLGLSCYGRARATSDVDLLVDEDEKNRLKAIFEKSGFTILHESIEVIQFTGIGNVDVLFARRPISQAMLLNTNHNGPEGIDFVKPEDLIGLKIQAYADLIGEWSAILEIKNAN